MLLEHSNAREVTLDGDELTFSAAEDDVAAISRAIVGAGLGIRRSCPSNTASRPSSSS
jgi:hypothetical protein